LKDLIILKGKEVFTNSQIIAEGTGNKHHSITAIIQKYESDFAEFGKVRFQIAPLPSGQSEKIYTLNEEQAALLMTYLRNSELVRQFKKELVRQFYAMRRLLLEHSTDEWKFFRKEGKPVRLAETATIKELTQYAKDRGSKNYGRLYTNYTVLANKTVGIKHIDDATMIQLNYLKLIENIFEQIIQSGMEGDKDYHDIFKDCKAKAVQLSCAVAVGTGIQGG